MPRSVALRSAVRLASLFAPLAAVVGACASFGSSGPTIADGGPASVDAANDGDGAVDAAPPPPDGDAECDLDAAFGKGVQVPGLADFNGGEVNDLRLSDDELTVYFASTIPFSDGGSSDYDLYVATRATTMAPFVAPTAIMELDSDANEQALSITSDGRYAFFTRRDVGDPLTKRTIWTASRTSTDVPFANLAQIMFPDRDNSDGFVRADGTRLWFAEHPQDAATDQVYYLDLVAGALPTTITVVEVSDIEIDAGEYDTYPLETRDGLTLYFKSNRTDQGGDSKNGDIWMATRTSKSVPYGGARRVAELSTANEDYASWVSADGCRLYYTSGSKALVASRGH